MTMHLKKIVKAKLLERFAMDDMYPYRKYFHKRKCIFIHIPKCAGTSILKSLSEGGRIHRDHADWTIFKKAHADHFDDYYKFTIVRNPFARLVSTYEYLKAGGNKGSDKEISNIINNDFDTFEKFVLRFLTTHRLYQFHILKPQYFFICDEFQRLQVDFCGRFESLETDMNTVFQKLHIPPKLSHSNRSSKSGDGKHNYFTKKEVVDRIVGLYEQDFNTFGYEKVPPK